MKIGLDWGGTKLEAIALDPLTNEEIVRIKYIRSMLEIDS